MLTACPSRVSTPLPSTATIDDGWQGNSIFVSWPVSGGCRCPTGAPTSVKGLLKLADWVFRCGVPQSRLSGDVLAATLFPIISASNGRIWRCTFQYNVLNFRGGVSNRRSSRFECNRYINCQALCWYRRQRRQREELGTKIWDFELFMRSCPFLPVDVAVTFEAGLQLGINGRKFSGHSAYIRVHTVSGCPLYSLYQGAHCTAYIRVHTVQPISGCTLYSLYQGAHCSSIRHTVQ